MRTSWMLAGVVALAALIAGCGSDDAADDSVATTATPTTAALPTTEPSVSATTVAVTPADTAAPETSAPPATETPATETPATETPATETPATETPATSPSGDLYHRDLVVGSCFDSPADGDFSTPLPPVDCATQHENEIFADGEYDAAAGEPFPGDALRDFALETCAPAYESFTGFDSDEAPIPFNAFTPDEDDWADGDRRVLCFASDPEVGFIGTVASAGLEAPDVRVLHVANVDGTVDLFLSSQSGEPVRVTDDPEEEQTFPPTFERGTRRVFYSRYVMGQSSQADIVVFDPETGEVTPLLATAADESAPRLSPDGSKIVYVSDKGTTEYDIWVMDVDGANPTQLTDNPERDANPSWSPDGSQIVFRARAGDNSDIWIMNADGSDLRRLTDDPAGDFDPVFSPDGESIAFTSDRSGNFDVWVMAADGSDPVNLTDHPATDEYPSWTADGQGITFTSDRWSRMIWLMRADGSEQTLFTRTGPSVNGTAIGPLG